MENVFPPVVGIFLNMSFFFYIVKWSCMLRQSNIGLMLWLLKWLRPMWTTSSLGLSSDVVTDSPSKVKILWYLRHPPFVFYTYLQAFHQQDVGFFLAEGGVPCASSIMAQHACVPGESWYHLRLLDWGLWRHQRRVEREVSDPGYTSWICLCHLGSHLHLGRHLCCGTDVSLSQHQPSGSHRHTLVDICLLLPGGMDAFLCSGPDSRIPGVHVGNPSQFGHCHSAHRLPTRDLPEGVLLAEGTFFIALWMDHRRECLEYQRPCRLLHVIARDNADVSHGALTARGGCHLCFSMCFIVSLFCAWTWDTDTEHIWACCPTQIRAFNLQ